MHTMSQSACCRVSISEAHCTKASSHAAQCLSVIAYYAGWVKTRKIKDAIDQTLLHGMDEANDIDKAVKFLISDAPFITGHVLAVDGGRSLSL